MSLAPRAVLVHRRSELDHLLAQHGTRGQAEFFLSSRGRDLAGVQQRHDALELALRQVDAAIPADWRRAAVEREDLPRLRFDPEDVVLAVGQDGLVANVAKYLTGQPVIGIDPEPEINPGVLVRHSAGSVAELLAAVAVGRVVPQRRCMVQAELDDGQVLRALNELYVGDPGHQSARYRILPPSEADAGRPGERQSSSGVVIGTGTGATGWCASLARERAGSSPGRSAADGSSASMLPGPMDESLAWFVREAWPSPSTGTSFTRGVLPSGAVLRLVSEGELVVFGDGLEVDRLRVGWGQQIIVKASAQHLTLI